MEKVSLIHAHPRYRIAKARLEKKAGLLLSAEGKGEGRVDIILADNRLLKALNKKFRKKDNPTDVLSFNFDEGDFLGEIYISLDRVRAHSRLYRCSFYNELWRLIIHGLFHLLGFTHGEKMSRKEAAWLK